ncbi:4'-phosphopantetheinyl transferase family protein [Streptomyces sp. NPDC058374]|uniref:4'-phosphopantetheinyl transferase family protein n=1 Tax=Streptomyces sp. NPDC058374 TaxID=3346466 RepID=UPI0036521181
MTAPREAHIWYLRPADLLGTDVPALYHSMLSEEERGRLTRFHFARDHDAFLAAHGLKRTALSTLFPQVAAEEWAFTPGRHRRPEIIAPQGFSTTRFSLTHTDGLVALLVAPEADCGVDAEPLDSSRDVTPPVRHTLTPLERERFDALPPPAGAEHFRRLWTLKEAYAKARGLGLRLPFDQVGFRIENTGIFPHFGPGVNDRGADWQFRQWTVGERHILSVALRRDGIGDFSVVRHTVPLVPSPTGPAGPAAKVHASGIAHYCADGPETAAYRWAAE